MRKVIFLGTPKFSVPILDRIIKNEFNLKGNKQKVLDQFVEMHNLT